MEKQERKQNVANLIVAECKVIIDLIENDAHKNTYEFQEFNWAELKAKMKELRRDTMKLQKYNEWRYR